MDTIGACMQCVDANGVLHWGYVVDPCIVGERLQKDSEIGNIIMRTEVVGEEYLPMISDWWRQEDDELKKQYLSPINKPSKWHANYGGSCDNDVHERFKCLMETVFGKAFIHETKDGYVTYNCVCGADGFTCEDAYLKEWVIYSEADKEMKLNGENVRVNRGLQTFID